MLWYFVEKNRHHVSLFNVALCLAYVNVPPPRTVGDIFGFFYFLWESYKRNLAFPHSHTLQKAIHAAANTYPGYHGVPTNDDGSKITRALQNLCVHDRYREGSHLTLQSLFVRELSHCDRHLFPLSWYSHSCFTVINADKYLSWIVHLADSLYDGLKQLHDDFLNVNSAESDCTACQSGQKCESGKHGKHGKPDYQCSSVTIVTCAGVLPLFYKYGFTYRSAAGLHGEGKKTSGPSDYQRDCCEFYKALGEVRNPQNGLPQFFEQLFQVINEFLTYIRYPFAIYLFAFWLVILAYVLYALIRPLDLLHIRSQWRLAYTHHLLPMHLLANKIPTSRTLYIRP
ncbi:uncharacterized protein BXIN_1608 [Babesia sp. Xinjiang]|uniref:uncharacterized protein n=1 Tax=Babesia sp. Xinjiang TaxID=462227 RepID=UPI000A2626C9|nr:uncharacterized protein BXIN_1608 [Babesia sp. Xinjiang]ORM42168.1 hypothetical protein BXIN_1608 [Babesia sp. Xinjiang]